MLFRTIVGTCSIALSSFIYATKVATYSQNIFKLNDSLQKEFIFEGNNDCYGIIDKWNWLQKMNFSNIKNH